MRTETHTHPHPHPHTHTGTCTHKQTDYSKLNLHNSVKSKHESSLGSIVAVPSVTLYIFFHFMTDHTHCCQTHCFTYFSILWLTTHTTVNQVVVFNTVCWSWFTHSSFMTDHTHHRQSGCSLQHNVLVMLYTFQFYNWPHTTVNQVVVLNTMCWSRFTHLKFCDWPHTTVNQVVVFNTMCWSWFTRSKFCDWPRTHTATSLVVVLNTIRWSMVNETDTVWQVTWCRRNT